MLEPLHQPLPFGRYLLLELLAEGGMAQVYRAVLRDVSGFEKQVALKRIRRELGEDPEFVARFIDEARIASTLNHGNIVQVFDFGQNDGEHFLAMELVDGPDLGTLIAACRNHGQPIPIPTATYIAAEVARGLGAAHQRLPSPVVHRDVSPQNVLLSRAGEVKVADFGIALAAEKVMRTRTGMVLGKFRYMAPEHARGEKPDARADVFAVGAVLFELLAGKQLFDANVPELVARQLLTEPIPTASSHNPDVPPELDEVLLRALDRDPERRPTDGAMLARELEALLHHMAPDFSVDDLAALMRATVPPPRWMMRQTAAATTTLTPNGDGDSVATDQSAAPTIAVDHKHTVTATQPANSLNQAPAPIVPSAISPGPRRRPALLLAAAAVGGALAGVAVGLVVSRSDRAQLCRGAIVEHAGLKVQLRELTRNGTACLVRLRVDGGDKLSLAAPRLLTAKRAEPARLSTNRRDGESWEWRLVFPVESSNDTDLVLELLPPATVRPLRLALRETCR